MRGWAPTRQVRSDAVRPAPATAPLTAPLTARTPEFAEIARAASSIDTLEAFLRDLRARYPEAGATATAPAPAPSGT